MMTSLMNVLHPTFDALSAFADDPNANRGATARHVALCPRCQETVRDIQLLGDSARQAEYDGPPSDLWSRIDAARSEVRLDDGSAASAAEELSRRINGKTSGTHRKWPRRLLIAGAALAAGVLALLALPGGRQLEASGVSRLAFSPGRPVPGGVLTIRYTPISWLKAAPRLVLVGRFSAPTPEKTARCRQAPSDSMCGWVMSASGLPAPFIGMGDSLATLLPDGAGHFTAKVRLPADFRMLQVSIVDSAGSQGDNDGYSTWGIVAGEKNGAPSFESFAGALLVAPHGTLDRVPLRNFASGMADSLAKYFPDHPLGWSEKDNYGVRKGRFDLLSFFETAQRRYSILYDKLSAQRSLDGERLRDMIAFSLRIDEPILAEMWIKRLVREHPEYPNVYDALETMLHNMELRMPEGPAKDSIRPWLPVLDSLAQRERPIPLYMHTFTLMAKYADPAMKARWGAIEADLRSERYATTGRVLADSEVARITPEAVERLRTDATSQCVLGAGVYPLLGTVPGWKSWCLVEKSHSLGVLARVAIANGDRTAARTYANSAQEALTAGRPCPNRNAPNHTLFLANVALGDTTKALARLARDYATGPQDRGIALARRTLGSQFDSTSFVKQMDSVRPEVQACQQRDAELSKMSAERFRQRSR